MRSQVVKVPENQVLRILNLPKSTSRTILLTLMNFQISIPGVRSVGAGSELISVSHQ
ncbi:hypothetical protein M595_1464 [Lyngbya aestuarii BL J]|uniref:Uncharacterized protein n=1 Tax=Lyngbya aestuarii BL J TaxID=1348334 RepID=U7QKR4_9CYAN|nr:hypothetical protein M595_1464 [Lyngbya aestuarii BL J]